jgi:hypothetical protein
VSLCGLVVRVPGYRTEMYSDSCEVRTEFIYIMQKKVDSLCGVSTTEELLGRKSIASGLENRDYGRRESAALTTRHPSIRKS